MKNKKYKVLVGVGCSHTQGCAVVDDQCIGDNYDEQINNGEEFYTQEKHLLATPELQEYFGKKYISAKTITEEVSWIGHLGDLLGVDEKVNLGAGGRGIEVNVQSLRNYAFHKKDLSDHIFFWMLPSFHRHEVLRYRDKGHYEGWTYTSFLNELSALLDGTLDGDDIYNKDTAIYAERFHHTEVIRYKLLSEIYFIQEYLKSLGARVVIFNYFNHDLEEMYPAKWVEKERRTNESEVQSIMTSNGSHYQYYKAPYIPIKELIKRLDIIDKVRFDEYGLFKEFKYKSTNMEEAGLRKDAHKSPEGNKWLAEALNFCYKNNFLDVFSFIYKWVSFSNFF